MSVPFSFQHSPMSRSVFPLRHMPSSPISEITSPAVTPARFPSPSPYPLSDSCRRRTWFSCFTFHLRVPWHIGVLSEIHTLSRYGLIHCHVYTDTASSTDVLQPSNIGILTSQVSSQIVYVEATKRMALEPDPRERSRRVAKNFHSRLSHITVKGQTSW